MNKQFRKAVVFCNGDLADVSRVRKYIDAKTLIVGCDGGTAHALSLGLTPHVVIGDFDSISNKTLRALGGKEVEYLRYPREKDFTDSELGLMYAKEKGCTDIILAGVRGTATDHFLGNLFLIAKKQYRAFNIKIVEGREEMMLLRKHIRIRGKKGDDVSLITIGPDAAGVTTKGLFYPLKNAVLKSGTASGIRNRLTGTHAEITLKKGALLVIHRVS